MNSFNRHHFQQAVKKGEQRRRRHNPFVNKLFYTCSFKRELCLGCAQNDFVRFGHKIQVLALLVQCGNDQILN